MSIKVKNSIGVVDVLAADTLLLTVSGKIGVESMSCHNDSANDVTVTFYVSPDATSAAGDQVDEVILSPNESIDINAMIGQGYADSKNLIAVGSLTGVNCSMSYTQFTGNDV